MKECQSCKARKENIRTAKVLATTYLILGFGLSILICLFNLIAIDVNLLFENFKNGFFITTLISFWFVLSALNPMDNKWYLPSRRKRL